MPTLTNTIPALSLVGNPVPAKFQASSNYLEAAGSKAEIVLTWTAAAVADEFFNLLISGETVKFTCKAAPDLSGTQFHDNSGADPLNTWVATVAEDLRKNYLLARDYDITVDGAAITITAKEKGSAWSLEFTPGSGIDCTDDDTDATGVDRKIRDFFRVVLMLYVNDEFVVELGLPVDDDGKTETDLAQYLKPYVESAYSWPESDSDFIFARSGHVASWYFKYGERWGEGEYQEISLSSTYHAMLGGLSFMQQALYNKLSSSFWAKLNYNNYFLSWAPLTRVISPDEPVKLYFLNHTAATTLKLKVKEYYTGGTDTTRTLDTIAGTDKQVYECVLSPGKIGLTGLDNETLAKYEVWIDNQSDTRVSEIRTYELSYLVYDHARHFLFLNSLGSYEVMRTVGILEKSGDYSREVAELALDFDFTSGDREETSLRNTERQTFKANTGWLHFQSDNAEEYRNWLRDFLLSKEVFQLIGNTLVPVRITTSSLLHDKDKEYRYALEFEFVRAFTDEYYTKELTPNLYDESFNSDFEKAH